MKTERLDLRLMDNMELMREFPDKHFDLAIVDPPYGIGVAKNGTVGSQPKPGNKRNGVGAPCKKFKPVKWDREIPQDFYFDELFRVSKNQVIWGGNYFNLPPTQGIVIWDKVNDGTDFADCELGWTSFDRAARIFRFRWNGMLQGDMANKEDRIHPTQKPVALYRWIFANYAKPGMRVLDTHLGSGSIAIAAHYAGVHLTACEIDPDYFAAACERIRRETMQEDMFQPPPPTLREVELPLDPSRL
jgi:site-specific DNA-methyltransferase (adenine-specific)